MKFLENPQIVQMGLDRLGKHTDMIKMELRHSKLENYE